MKLQSAVLVHLGFGKYVRSDQVTAVIPIEEERGPGRRTFVHLQGEADPIVASRAEDTIVRDLVQEPREVTPIASTARNSPRFIGRPRQR
jgi:hypothetical protein